MAFGASPKAVMGKGKAQAYGDYYKNNTLTPNDPGPRGPSGPSSTGNTGNKLLQSYGGTKGTPFEKSRSPYIAKQDDNEEELKKAALKRRLKKMKRA